MDFNNHHPQVNTSSSTRNIALIKLIHEGHSLVESFIKFGSAYNNNKKKKGTVCVHLYSNSINLPIDIIQFAHRFILHFNLFSKRNSIY